MNNHNEENIKSKPKSSSLTALRSPLTIVLPMSKSIDLRLMACMAVERLRSGDATPLGWPAGDPGLCDDSRTFLQCLDRLIAMQPGSSGDFYLGDGAAPYRFFTAIARQLPDRDIRITCSPQLSRRPIRPLLDALESISNYQLSINNLSKGNSLKQNDGDEPTNSQLLINNYKLLIDTAVSSQYVSALMLAAPLMSAPLQMIFTGTERPVSMPYIAMTAAIMRSFGHDVALSPEGVTVTPRSGDLPAGFSPLRLREPDWSAASYFYEIASLLPGMALHLISSGNRESGTGNLKPELQGDAACRDLFAALGVVTQETEEGILIYSQGRTAFCADKPYEASLEDTPDLAPALICALALGGTPFRLTGLATLKYKESNRLLALSEALAQLGISLSVGTDSVCYGGRRFIPDNDRRQGVHLNPHGDHRIAMALAPVLLMQEYVGNYPLYIDNSDVVAKSMPGFWKEFSKINTFNKISTFIKENKSKNI